MLTIEKICKNEQSCIHTGFARFCYAFDLQIPTTFPTLKEASTTFPTLKLWSVFVSTTIYCGVFLQKTDPSVLGISTKDKEKPRKTEVFRGKKNFFSAWRTGGRGVQP